MANMTRNIDWDKLHEEVSVYMQSIDNMSPLGRWVINWADVPSAGTIALYRSFDDKPIVVGQYGLCAVSVGAPLPPDFFSLPKLAHTHNEIWETERKRQQTGLYGGLRNLT